MATGQSNQLTRQIGEHLVTAELGRRGVIATPFAGNVPQIDILAHKDGKSFPIQVKAINMDAWQFDIRVFLQVDLKGKRQIVKGPQPEFNKRLLCIYVKLNQYGSDEFYIFKQGALQQYFMKRYKSRIRTKNFESFHCAIRREDLKKFKENWNRILLVNPSFSLVDGKFKISNIEFKKYKCTKGINLLAKIPFPREFFINHVSVILSKAT